MGNNQTKRAYLFITLMTAFILALLVGCGGKEIPTGTGTTGTVTGTGTGTNTTSANLTLRLTDAAGATVTSISAGAPTTVKATVLNSAGAAAPNIVVTFTTNATLATMTPANGTALTDASGVAQISLSPASLTASGATTISASAQVDTTAVSNSLGFSIGAATVAVTNPVFGVGTASLSAFGTTSVSVNVTSGGVAMTTPQTVTFSSACAASGKAVLGSVVTVNGTATGSYRDNGCAGTDTVTASVSGGLATSSASLTVTAPVTGSIQYVSANPTNIALKGSGGINTSQVTFKVTDSGGNPISGKTVTFGLSTTVGGVTLTSTTGISDAAGLVVAMVNSGTVSTPVRVTASTPGTGTTILTSQSSQLSVTTGIADQTGFSLAASTLNIEGLSHDGVTTVMTARLADHFKNPAPDGTTVNFTTEAGSIVGTCNTTSGGCSATLTSQGLRPSNGRATVLAYAVGEESFVDLDGDGAADLSPNEMLDINGASTDLAEAYVDYDENGARGTTEPFVDFDLNGAFTAADGKFSGVLCGPTSSAGTCATTQTVHVRSSNVIVFSGSTAYVTAWSTAAIPVQMTSIDLSNGCSNLASTSPFTVKVLDVNGNAMPAGTTIALSTNNGTIKTATSNVVPSTNGCSTGVAGCISPYASTTLGSIPVSMVTDATKTPGPPATCTDPTGITGFLSVTVTTPRGFITTTQIPVND